MHYHYKLEDLMDLPPKKDLVKVGDFLFEESRAQEDIKLKKLWKYNVSTGL